MFLSIEVIFKSLFGLKIVKFLLEVFLFEQNVFHKRPILDTITLKNSRYLKYIFKNGFPLICKDEMDKKDTHIFLSHLIVNFKWKASRARKMPKPRKMKVMKWPQINQTALGSILEINLWKWTSIFLMFYKCFHLEILNLLPSLREIFDGNWMDAPRENDHFSWEWLKIRYFQNFKIYT